MDVPPAEKASGLCVKARILPERMEQVGKETGNQKGAGKNVAVFEPYSPGFRI